MPVLSSRLQLPMRFWQNRRIMRMWQKHCGESLKEEVGDFPLILMGHGTEHAADASYAMMEQSLRAYAKHEIYIATVEGSITIEDVIARMKSGLQSRQNGKVLLTPFMLVAGDHANNDMAGGMQDGEQTGCGFLCRKIAGGRIPAGMCDSGNWGVSGCPGGVSDSFATGNEKIIL